MGVAARKPCHLWRFWLRAVGAFGQQPQIASHDAHARGLQHIADATTSRLLEPTQHECHIADSGGCDRSDRRHGCDHRRDTPPAQDSCTTSDNGPPHLRLRRGQTLFSHVCRAKAARHLGQGGQAQVLPERREQVMDYGGESRRSWLTRPATRHASPAGSGLGCGQLR